MGLTRTLSRWIYRWTGLDNGRSRVRGSYSSGSVEAANAHLIKCFCIEQDPTQLDHLGRVLRHVDSVLIAGGSNVNDHVAVDVKRGWLRSGHRHEIGPESSRKGDGELMYGEA